jgi:hypothetical protein
MSTRNVIDDIYEIDIVDEGTRHVQVWGLDVPQEESTTHVSTYIISITDSGYDRMKRDLEEYHNMLKWLDVNPESKLSYGMWDTVRLLKL